MILPSSTYEKLVISIRKCIIDYLGINKNRVMNSASVRGADLAKQISECVYTSYNLNDVFMTFLCEEANDAKYIVIHEKDNTTSSFMTYDFNLKIYGSASHTVSQKLLCIFKEEDILLKLRNEGIYVRGVTTPKISNEFINNTFWSRADISIKCEIRHNFTNSYSNDVLESGNYISPNIIIKRDYE